jgi:hypothetical protein
VLVGAGLIALGPWLKTPSQSAYADNVNNKFGEL